MREYTNREIKELESNPYTFKVTKKKLYFTKEFKKEFWIRYQAGNTPRVIMEELGYNLEILRQKQIDGIVQRIKKEALSGEGFSEGYLRKNRIAPTTMNNQKDEEETDISRLRAELLYLRQEVEFLKKNIIADHMKKKR